MEAVVLVEGNRSSNLQNNTVIFKEPIQLAQWLIEAGLYNLLGILSCYKTEDETINSNDTLTDDVDLIISDIPIGLYNIKFILYANASIIAGIKFSFSASGAMDMKYSNTTFTIAPSSLSTVTTISGVGSERGLIYEGILDVTVSGDLQFKWSQNTSDVSDSILLKNSFIQLIKI